MLFSKPEGPWIVTRGRFLTHEEYCRFQGVDYNAWIWASPAFARKSCGNAITAPLIARILRPLASIAVGREVITDEALVRLWRQRLCDWSGASIATESMTLDHFFLRS